MCRLMQTHHDAAAVGRMIDALASAISTAYPPSGGSITIVGIRTRGEVLAERLVKLLQKSGHYKIERGVLDITLYRDDLPKSVPGQWSGQPASIPTSTANR